jgi:hypothetical protein
MNVMDALRLLRAVGPLAADYNPGSVFDPDELLQPAVPVADQFDPAHWSDGWDDDDPDTSRECPDCGGDCEYADPYYQ